MGFIRFNITRVTDYSGKTEYTRISRIESDLPPSKTLETNIIWNAFSRKGGICAWMVLDVGLLGRDMLAESTNFTLDRDMLDVDKLI